MFCRQLLQVAGLVGVLCVFPVASFAQGVGLFQRADCTTITSPVAWQTYCLDTTAAQAGQPALKVWNGSSYVAVTGGSGTIGVASLNGLMGALTIAGTTNQVTVTPAGATITLATPQDIATTSTVTWGNEKVTGNPVTHFAPTGNTPDTIGSFIQQTTAAGGSRIFAGSFGLTVTGGSAGDKVALYAGLDKVSGTNDAWSVNTVLTQEAGSGSYNAQGYELDFNNINAHRGDGDGSAGLSAPVSYGLSLTGASTFRKTAAILVSENAGMWNRGIVFGNDSISATGSAFQDLNSLEDKSIDIRGGMHYAIYQSGVVPINYFNGGVILGAPTGGNKGSGNINVAGGFYVNGVLVSGTGTVTTSGSPVSGNLTKFSSATAITNGDLSGDVTTSGTLVTTLAASGVSAGSCGDTTHSCSITVDAKGRVTVQSNNVIASGAGTVTHTGNLTAGQLVIGNGVADLTVGNLTGDVTTSGTTATSLSLTGIAAGTYGNVTVNTKGRVTSGTTINDVPHGGTGDSSFTANAILIGNGAGAIQQVLVGGVNRFLKGTSPPSYSSVDLATGQVTGFLPVGNISQAVGGAPTTVFLRGDGAWAPTSGLPGGVNTDVQFNNSGVFGGSSNMTFDGANIVLQGMTADFVTANGNPRWIVAEIGTGAQIQNTPDPGAYHPFMKFILNNTNNPTKTGIYCESVEGVQPGMSPPNPAIANECFASFHFSQTDNGHDASGITGVEWGNGNAATFLKFVGSRPAGLPALLLPNSRQYGYAIEASSQGNSTTIAASAAQGISLAASVGNTVGPPWAEGVRIYPATDPNNLGSRIALLVSKTQDNLDTLGAPAFAVFLNGDTQMYGDLFINSMVGSGTAPACFNAAGHLYRGTNVAGVLSCP